MTGKDKRRTKRLREVLATMASLSDDAIPLAHAALLIAAEEYRGLDIPAYIGQIDRMAAAVHKRLGFELEPLRIIEAMNAQLFDEEGFRGNTEDYYDPRNSFLNEVLDRRTGIPISLAVIYMEVAWRLNLPLVGVGMPGHFIVKYQGADAEILIDPFHGGTILSQEDCRQTLDRIYQGRIPFTPEVLAATSRRQILVRILSNLKAVYVNQADHRRALATVERLLLISPDTPGELRDRGLLYATLHRLPQAAADLKRYLQVSPEAEDRETIVRHLRHLQMRQAMDN